MELILWCDESIQDGFHYSDFYGGILIESTDLDEVHTSLENKKAELGFNDSEIKWSKVTSQYLDKYIEFVSVLFDLIALDKAKIRIMFRQSAMQAKNISDYNKDKRYHLLYYQFIKHAFGFRYSNLEQETTYLRTYFDKIPEKNEDNELFKNNIYALQSQQFLGSSGIKIRRDDITEVDSKKHIELQALDLVLGSMAFRLNDHHKVKSAETNRRGKRTIAKEKLYKYINSRIRQIYPGFNIGISTGTRNGKIDFWNDPYRHWRFVPREYRIDESKYK